MFGQLLEKKTDKDVEPYPEKTMFQNLRVVSSVTSEESDRTKQTRWIERSTRK